MPPHETSVEILSRIIVLETRLTNTIDKIDRLIDTVEERHSMLAGDGNTPSLISRVIALESFQGSVRWSLGILYTSMVGLVVNKLMEKL